MRDKRIIALLAIISLMFSLSYGCGKDHAASGNKKLAVRINNYEMTVDDFRDQASRIASNKYLSGDPDRVKEQLLEEMITKQVLLQEAQRQNFDKDEVFMDEIERYWEQALLKILYKKKSKELAASITVSDKEALDEYRRLLEEGDIDAMREPFEKVSREIRADIRNRKLQQALNLWINTLKANANIKRYKDNLKGIRIKR